MSTSPNPSSGKWADAARRFGFYFIGLAIGLVLLGFFQMKRQQQAAEMKARQDAALQQAAPSAPPDNSNPPQNQPAPK